MQRALQLIEHVSTNTFRDGLTKLPGFLRPRAHVARRT